MQYPSGLCLLFLMLFSWNGISQTSGDSLFEKAKEALRQQDFEKAYQGFEEASQHFLDLELYDRYVEALLQQARMTQFTRSVSMTAVPEIIGPIATLLEENKIERNHVNTASYYVTLGFYHERVSGDFSEALSLFDHGLAVCAEVGHPADTQKLMMMIEISRVHLIQERFDLAMDFGESAFELSSNLLGKTHRNSANAYYHLAHIYYRSGRYDQAEALLREGIRILQDINAPEIQLGLGYQNLFTTDVARLDLKSARANADRAIEIYRKYFGDGHETIGSIFRDLGVKHLLLSQPDSAIHFLLKAMKIYTDRFGPTYPELHLIYHNLGNAYTASQQFELATTYHLKGLEIQNTSSREIVSYMNLAHNFIESGQFQEAQIYLDRSEQLAKDSLFENSINISRLHHTKGLFYYEQDSFLQAARSWHRSLMELNRAKGEIPLGGSPPLDSFLNLVYGVEHAVLKGRALFNHYKVTGKRSDLELSIEVMQSADQLMEKLRSSYRNSESKIYLQKKGRNHYENILEASLAGWTTHT
ncbi:MAG: tetratricopeptide repeat protein [Saprospiraceae bacterium]|nr:tetratricopeptide repeat protein [Saprospiraceae bacterium]